MTWFDIIKGRNRNAKPRKICSNPICNTKISPSASSKGIELCGRCTRKEREKKGIKRTGAFPKFVGSRKIEKNIQERTFVIESYSTEDEPYKDISVNAFLTAKELEIEEDATQEEIEKDLLEWIGKNIGTVNGYGWYEITAEGKKRDWLNPRGDYELV